GITQRRELPRFFICDASMQVLFSSAGIKDAILSEESLRMLEPQSRQSKASKSVLVHAFDDETVLRIMPLDGRLFGCVAIFVDVFVHRGSVVAAAKKFALT